MGRKGDIGRDLKLSLLLGVIAMICSFTKIGGPIVGAVVALFGFRYGKRAAKDGKPLSMISLILNTVPFLYLLLWLFIIGYVLTVR